MAVTEHMTLRPMAVTLRPMAVTEHVTLRPMASKDRARDPEADGQQRPST